MSTPLRLLIVEDSTDDAELLLLEVRRGGFDPGHLRVDTPEDMEAALDSQEWDLVLADYSMPRFSGTQALAIVRGRGLDLPFIFVSGTIGEDTAVAAMKAGAQDYLTKNSLKRLVPAIERELREAGIRRERARAEAKLRQLQQAVEQSASLIVITDAEGSIEYVNPRFLAVTGYSADEVVGRKPSLWRSGATPEAEYAALWRSIRAGEDWRGEFTNRRKDGGLISVFATISPIRDAGGQITHFIAIEEDITQQKQMEEQLRRAQKMEAIGQLTGGLAHDFNNLLTVVIGSLDLLEQRLESGSEARDLAQTALGASLRGADLTRQLLAFARRQSLDPQVCDLNVLVAGMMDLLRRTLGEQIQIAVVPAADLWPALADPTQVESALANLAINARDAMPEGGMLTIETANRHVDALDAAANVEAQPGAYVMLAVSDTGTGMPPEIVARVFEPFFTTKPQGKGTGLGLSMVYGFVKQSRGHVRIDSTVGLGTSIGLYLPKADAVGARVAEAEAPAEPQRATGEATILLVEDNDEVRYVVARQLKDMGYRVVEAASAAAALTAMREATPGIDLLFSDVVMPGGMSGLDLAREVRKLRPELKVLLTSGFAEESLQGVDRSTEAIGFLGKPYRRHDLARRVRETLKR
jgi:PAS domain S-box-containing protein